MPGFRARLPPERGLVFNGLDLVPLTSLAAPRVTKPPRRPRPAVRQMRRLAAIGDHEPSVLIEADPVRPGLCGQELNSSFLPSLLFDPDPVDPAVPRSLFLDGLVEISEIGEASLGEPCIRGVGEVCIDTISLDAHSDIVRPIEAPALVSGGDGGCRPCGGVQPRKPPCPMLTSDEDVAFWARVHLSLELFGLLGQALGVEVWQRGVSVRARFGVILEMGVRGTAAVLLDDLEE